MVNSFRREIEDSTKAMISFFSINLNYSPTHQQFCQTLFGKEIVNVEPFPTSDCTVISPL